MSYVSLVEQASAPATPPAGKARIYINSGGTVSSVDDAGVVTTYGAGVTTEQVQDIVGAMLQDTSTIDATYNDAGNVMFFDVIPGGVNHNALANLTTGNPHTQYLLGATAAVTYQPLDGDLTAVASLVGTGLIARTAANAMTTRTITAGSSQVSVANGDGVSGNPTLDVVPANINHNSLLNGGGTTHIDHATVSIVAGTYMTGGGDITASRTLNHANSAVTAGSYGGVNAIPVLTVGATGHVDAASTVNTTSALLTGLSPVLGGGTVVATDTLLAAFNKLVGESNNWTELCTASTYTNSSNITGVNVTELALSVVNGRRYYYEATLLFQTAATTTGIAVTITSPDGASAPGALLVGMPIAADGTAALYSGTINTLGDYVTSTGVQTANVPFVVHLKGNFPCNGSGTFNITFRSEVLGSQVTVLPGSTLLVREFV